jgi:hypothetical protein
MRVLSLAVITVIVAGVGMQTVRPSLTPGKGRQPEAQIVAPPKVLEILQRRCYTCHSNEPRLAWFDQVAPVYWLVTHDVRDARAHLNFSELGTKPAGVQRAELFEAVNQVQLGAMPLPRYLAAHRGSGVTAGELTILKEYLAPFAPAKTPTAVSQGADPATQTDTSVAGGTSLNDARFHPDYKRWQILSTTDRGDNGTLRIITGNDVAIRAVVAGTTNPWPDGAVFAKNTFQAVDDGNGHITAGKFVQVEFMEKDAAARKSTQGWAYSRWRGPQLKPYGTTAHFDDECTGCHKPMRDNDYVYTQPIVRGSDGGSR